MNLFGFGIRKGRERCDPGIVEDPGHFGTDPLEGDKIIRRGGRFVMKNVHLLRNLDRGPVSTTDPPPHKDHQQKKSEDQKQQPA